MISIDHWPLWIAVIVIGGPILLSYVIFFYSLYLSRRHLERLIVALSNSRAISIDAENLARGGWLARLLLVSKITLMVMWPGSGLRNGDINVSDIRDFPESLRYLLKVKAVLTGGTLIWAAIAFLLVKFR